MKKKLSAEGIEHLFPVQAKVIPWLLQEHKKSEIFWPRDLCVSAPTGSGKTLAYVLPIIQVINIIYLNTKFEKRLFFITI